MLYAMNKWKRMILITDVLVAICHEVRQRRRQRDAEERQGQLTIGKDLGSKSCAEAAPLLCLRLPY